MILVNLRLDDFYLQILDDPLLPEALLLFLVFLLGGRAGELLHTQSTVSSIRLSSLGEMVFITIFSLNSLFFSSFRFASNTRKRIR
jgi:hypothetical protein